MGMEISACRAISASGSHGGDELFTALILMHSFTWISAGKPDAKAQASKAAKAVKKGTFKRTRKPRYSVVFHRPSTLKRTRDPKYTRIR